MSLRTAVGQVAVVGGDPSERPSGVLVDERASRSAKARRRGNLYVLVELSGPALGRDLIARQLLETVRTAYYAWQGSVTAGLQQAIHEVNTALFNQNRDSLPGDQRTGGVSCAVLRDDDLFIAQAGPAAVYLAHDGQVTRFPDVSPWIDDRPSEDPDVAPLGARREVNVALFHTPMSDGDLILLVESTFVRSLPSSTLPHLLTNTPVEELPAALVASAKGSDLSALVVSVGAEDQVPALTIGPVSAPVAGQPAPESVQEKLATLARRIPAQEFLRKTGRALLALLGALWAGISTLLKRMLPGQVSPELPAARPTAQAPKVGSELNKHPREDRAVQPRFHSLRKLLVALTITILVIVGIVVVSMFVHYNRTQKAEVAALWANANQSWEQGRAAADRGTSRPLLKAAIGYLDELIARQSDNTAANDLRKQVVARLDEIGMVQRVSDIRELATYAPGALLTRVVVQDSDIYVLDGSAGRIYHHELDASRQALQAGTENTVLVKRGDTVGGVVVGDLVDMAWVAASDVRPQASLVILESNGNLVQYVPITEQLTSLRPAGADTWQNPKLVGSYFGRYYVLDPPPDKIWRYQPTADGYSAPPDDWLQVPVDLNGVIDMAIGDSIYLLYVDGKVSRLTTGRPDTFDVTDWDAPPSNPGAIFARPPDELQSVYVADRGNERIVKSGVDGRFQGQFILDPSVTQGKNPLSSVTSLFVNELDKQAFFVSGNALYVFALP
jgi:hypothetical protein